jgi:sulfur relay (sulfurtransferase) DsrC/TusE family protein
MSAHAITFDDRLEILSDVARIRWLRAKLERFTVSPSVRRISQLTPREQGTLFDLLRTIDHLFPGVPIMLPEAAG